MNRKFAVFDLDGTLIRWQLYHAMADEFVKMNILTAKEYESVKTARMNWKNRDNINSFNDYEMTLVKLINSTVQNLKVSDLEKACLNVIEEYKNQVYTYTRDLIKELKSQNYLVFAISASPNQIVKLVANHYGFDDYSGSIYAEKDGILTGKYDLVWSDRKPEILKDLVDKHQATWIDSVAVGDSEGDIPMLSSVEQPIAFNPTQILFTEAKKKGWKIVVERKNMVYRLDPRDGTYILA